MTPIRRRRVLRIGLPVLATLLVLLPLAWLWAQSRVPSVYSVTDMGSVDYGGGPGSELGAEGHVGHQQHGEGPARSVADLVADPKRRADVRVDLVARRQDLTVGGQTIPGYTLNGTSPGPQITARQGQLVEVSLRNASVSGGTTLHWHGLDVPNAMDGVAGVTQDSVPVGGTFTYRFVAEQVGTFWYHAHQLSNGQVAGGLLAALVVLPSRGQVAGVDTVAVSHTYGGVRTVNGRPGDTRVEADPGQRVRVRVINTDNGPIKTWASAPYRVVAVDGTELRGPTPVDGQAVTVTAGGRADLEVTMPGDGSAVRVQVSKSAAVLLGAGQGDVPAPPQPVEDLDLLRYGTAAKLPFDPATATRRFDYVVDRRPGFVRGRPGLWWSINGHLYPDVPMMMVREGDVVRMRVENASGEVHPMHLHGHHAVVLSRNGVPSTGSPWWVDSLNVLDGESYELAFVADNPGVWMDHCHNLKHAADGMVAHLMYAGVDTPYRAGSGTGNQPE